MWSVWDDVQRTKETEKTQTGTPLLLIYLGRTLKSIFLLILLIEGSAVGRDPYIFDILLGLLHGYVSEGYPGPVVLGTGYLDEL
jgi:hypothetical protein